MNYLILLIFFLTNVMVVFAQNSVLSTGTFYKIKVSKDGIHKITAQNLNDMGIDIGKINPKRIQLYGNTTGMLPQKNDVEALDDLQEFAISVVGEEDGKFEKQDYILFYAQGADRIFLDTKTNQITHEKNLYDAFNYYYLTIGTQDGKRISKQVNPPKATKIYRYTDMFQFYEKDAFNLLATIKPTPGGSGRKWYSTHFDFQTSYSFKFDLKGILSNSVLGIEVAALGRSTKLSAYKISANGREVGELLINPIRSGTYETKARERNAKYSVVVSSSLAQKPQLNLNLKFIKQENDAEGYLDYIRLNYRAKARLYKQQTILQAIASQNDVKAAFELENIDDEIQVWDITAIHTAQRMTLSGKRFDFNTQGKVRKFVLFKGSDFDSPEFVKVVEKQNLHASPTPHLLIITHPNFRSAAQKLADFRQTNDGLDVLLVTTEQIYNEFSSGRQDVTAIRNFIRFLYKKESNKFRYVLLVGDASFDYKNRIPNNTNFIPIYQARNSFDPIYSYSSDDYYSFMEDGEGEWAENARGNHTLELGIGRLPVQSPEQAEAVVQKLINYPKKQTLGSWRNQFTFVADDGDDNIHFRDTEALTRRVDQNHTSYNINKLYIDAFQQELKTSGKVSPIVQNLLKQQIEKGVLIVNYMGHGAESGWASENILDIPQINSLSNYNNLPLFVTATCEFGRFDNPIQTSGGESLILNPKGGGVSLLTTTRPVFSNTNFRLARAFYQVALKPIDGQFPRLGDVLRQTKNNSLDVINRNFTLLGDPSLRLNYPKQTIRITSVRSDGQNVTSLKALETIEIRGEVQKNKQLDTSFEGLLDIKIYDKPIELQTLGDESLKASYQTLKSVLFSGQATVSAGKFEFKFIVPKDIVYTQGNGKISLYAYHKTQNTDASGYKRIAVGGSQTSNLSDKTPPNIALFLENKRFKNGDEVPSNTQLLANLSDKNGINTTGTGVGHDIIAFLDGDESKSWVLNSFYQANKDDFQAGTIQFPLQNLTTGKHTLTLRVWDTYNNSSEKTIEFVVKDPPIQITDLKATPNPVNDETFISFKHNRAGQHLEVLLRIYDAQGKVVKNGTYYYTNSNAEIKNIRWNATNNVGNKLSRGVYIYRIVARSLHDNAYTLAHGKLVLMP